MYDEITYYKLLADHALARCNQLRDISVVESDRLYHAYLVAGSRFMELLAEQDVEPPQQKILI